VWYKFSRNLPAHSCREAAHKRQRLGHEGIPLWDELKSLLGIAKPLQGDEFLFLAHCRVDRSMNFSKLGEALGGCEIRRASQEILAVLNLQYGLVNQFIVPVGMVQLFDLELNEPLGTPETVMTNAGDFIWSVEFSPSELVNKSSNFRWAEFVSSGRDQEDFWGVRDPRTIGILTGNPTRSGLELCEAIGDKVQGMLGINSLGDVSMPPVTIVSLPCVGLSMEMDQWTAFLREKLVLGVRNLAMGGARIIAHPANTSSYFAPEMRVAAESAGAIFISIAEALTTQVREWGLQEITLLGTRFVSDFTLPWSVYCNAFPGIKVHVPSERGWDKIHQLAFEVQQHGPTPLALNWMRDLLRDEVPASCHHVALAMTEFTPVAKQMKSRGRQDKILIDPMDIYAEVIARQYLGL